MGGLEEWVDFLLYSMIVFTGRLCMGGFVVFGWVGCLWVASSLCRSYEAKSLQMKKKSSSENSPRYIFGFSKFTL